MGASQATRYVNLDRNGNVASIQPEAVVVSSGDSVTYQLREPSATNWEFVGVQLAECTPDFAGIDVTGQQITLIEHKSQEGDDQVEVTLLYVLADTRYYGDGDDPSLPPTRKLKKNNSVHAFDPLIIREN